MECDQLLVFCIGAIQRYIQKLPRDSTPWVIHEQGVGQAVLSSPAMIAGTALYLLKNNEDLSEEEEAVNFTSRPLSSLKMVHPHGFEPWTQ